MPKICLAFDGKVIREYMLDSATPLVIGRLPDNDVVIQDPSVSRLHAKIVFSEGSYLVTDLRSKNGLLVNKELVSSRRLDHGDVLTVGGHRLIFLSDDDELQLEVDVGKTEESPVIETAEEVTPVGTIPSAPHSPPEGREAELTGVLSYLAGGQGETTLRKKLIKVGRDSTCDMVVGGRSIGKIAFTVERRDNGYYLSYVEGGSVPKVSGQAVRRSMKLEESDIIEIGSTKLQFFTDKGIPSATVGRRMSYRKKTKLPGTYTVPNGRPTPMTVVSLSKGGLRIRTAEKVEVKKEDVLKVDFALDDESGSRITADVLVRHISKESIGCRFNGLAKRSEKSLRSYLG